MRKACLLYILMGLALTGCFGGTANQPRSSDPLPPSPAPAETRQEPIRLGFTVLGSFEFTDMIKIKLEDEASSRENIELFSYEGNVDAEQQIADVKDMIAKKVDVIILNPLNAAKSNEAVQLAINAGIPVVGINTIPDTDGLTTYVGSNDIQAGEIQMQYIAETLGGEGNIVILRGHLAQSSQIQRARGILNVLDKYPNIRVLEEETANWSRSEAYDLMKKWHAEHGSNIGAVVSHNDGMALGALDYMEEAGISVPIIGVDAIPDALQAVKDGKLSATVFQDATGQAKMALNLAINIAQNGQVAKSYFIPYRLVTQENVDYFIRIR
ncbi:substrate-binding domain-containing protein [Paenibacillaceae bacterium WGS1546]|uniref:substrate-binding domain-containing protein n=1 Tax=Cohnella sp. WGS1546 TaxID=3366810 RepID=UPI00372D6FC1